MKRKLLNLTLISVLSLFSTQRITAQTNVTVSGSANWLGYANVFNLGGGYEFGSSWGVPDLKSVVNVANNTVTIYPNYNTYNATDPYWSNGAGQGNKNFEANTFVENPALAGQTVTFSGFVLSNTLVSGYQNVAFIKGLDPNNGYADVLGLTAPLTAGQNFSITANNIPSGLIVQYGFKVFGLNANPVNEATNGNVVIGASNLSNFSNGELKSFALFPNPVIDNLNIETLGQLNSFKIYNTLGQNVLSSSVTTNSIDVTSLNSGIYIINAMIDGELISKKFLKI